MIQLSNVTLVHGERALFSGADLFVRPDDRIGLVGLNGAGKSTVFRLITGDEKPDSGDVSVQPGTVIGHFSQDTGEMSGGTLMETVLAGAGRVSRIASDLAELEHRMSDPEGEGLSDAEMDRYGDLQNEFLHLDGYDLENRAQAILSGLGFARDRWDRPVDAFSGGWKMRIALARILLLDPDVLLMDEPTNHLDVESIAWLEQWLMSFKGAIVLTSHDREFMTRLCDRTVEVGAGAITSYSGDYDFYLREREIRREQLLAAYNKQQASIAKDEEFIARFAARASHAAQVQSRVKMLDKIDRVVIPPDPKVIKIQIPPAKRSGDIVADIRDLAKSWPLPGGGEHKVFSGLNATINRGDKIALTGVNGAGKSTLLKVITGQADPSAGEAVLGAILEMGYFSQYSATCSVPATAFSRK
jgi:ATP-binding cassette subfamily F protein 3